MNNSINSSKVNENILSNERNKAKIAMLRRTSQQKHIMRINQARLKLESEAEQLNARYMAKTKNSTSGGNRDNHNHGFTSSTKQSTEKNQTDYSSSTKPVSASDSLENIKKHQFALKTKTTEKYRNLSKTDDFLSKTSHNFPDNSKFKKFRSAPVKRNDKTGSQDNSKKNSKASQRSLIPQLQRKAVSFEPKATIIHSPRQRKKLPLVSSKFSNSDVPDDATKKERENNPAIKFSNVKPNKCPPLNLKITVVTTPAKSTKKCDKNDDAKEISNDKPQPESKNDVSKESKNKNDTAKAINNEKQESKSKNDKSSANHRDTETFSLPTSLPHKNIKFNDKNKRDINFSLKTADTTGSKNIKKEQFNDKSDEDIDSIFNKIYNFQPNVICDSPDSMCEDYLQGKSSVYKLLQNRRMNTAPYTSKKRRNKIPINKWRMISPNRFALLMSKRRSLTKPEWTENSNSDASFAEVPNQLDAEDQNAMQKIKNPCAKIANQSTAPVEDELQLVDLLNSDTVLSQLDSSDSGDINSSDEMVEEIKVFKEQDPVVDVATRLEAIKLRERGTDSVKASWVTEPDIIMDGENFQDADVNRLDDAMNSNKDNSLLQTPSTRSGQSRKIPVWQKFVQSLSDCKNRPAEPKPLIRTVHTNKPTINIET